MNILNSAYYKFLQRKSRVAAILTLGGLCLVAIPVLLSYGHTSSARITGFVFLLVVAVLIYWLRMRHVNNFRKKLLVRLDRNDIFWLEKHIPFYKALPGKQREIFRSRIRLFLAGIIVTEIGKEVPERSTCLYVASAAVIAFWGLPYWNYGELTEVLVYPQNFDADNALNKRGLILGKVHHGGLLDSTMILSLPALKYGFLNDEDRHNVGVHEFSHLLDKEDGQIDGVPFFINPSESELWKELVDREMKKIKQGKSDVDKYGQTNSAEFFAVIMEYYRESPEKLKKKHEGVYAILDEHLGHPQPDSGI